MKLPYIVHAKHVEILDQNKVSLWIFNLSSKKKNGFLLFNPTDDVKMNIKIQHNGYV